MSFIHVVSLYDFYKLITDNTDENCVSTINEAVQVDFTIDSGNWNFNVSIILNQIEKIIFKDVLIFKDKPIDRRVFKSFPNLEILELSKFYDNTNNLNNLFRNCRKLKEIVGINNWDVSKVISMNSMFLNCVSLEKLDLTNWDTSNIIDMAHMFESCASLEEINVSNWNLEKCEKINSMFSMCSDLNKITGLDTWILNDEISVYCMFYKTKADFSDLTLPESIEPLYLTQFNELSY